VTLIYFDADNVGDVIELFLRDGKLNEAAAASKRIKTSVGWLKEELQVKFRCEVPLHAGDDLIAVIPDRSWDLEAVEAIRSEFEVRSGVTISAGVGSSVEEALDNLRRAKLKGKNLLVGRK